MIFPLRCSYCGQPPASERPCWICKKPDGTPAYVPECGFAWTQYGVAFVCGKPRGHADGCTPKVP